jgi:hypothetical protein
MSFLNVYYITLCRLYEKHLILNEVLKLTSVFFKNGYICKGSLYCKFTQASQSQKEQKIGTIRILGA